MIEKKQLTATVLTLLMVVSMAGAFAPAAVAGSSGAPSGMAGVPAEQVEVNLPDHAAAELPSEAAIANGLYASSHASTLEIEVTTREAAGGEGNVIPGGSIDGTEFVIVASDDVNHDGRTLGVDRSILIEAFGSEPSIAHGQHSSGDDWATGIEYDGSYALIDVPKFSSNEITFSGGVALRGDKAADGTTFSYEVDDTESVDNFDIDLEGVLNEQPSSTNVSVEQSTDNVTVDVGGNADPIETTVTVDGSQGGTFGIEWTDATNVDDIERIGLNELWVHDSDGNQIGEIDLESDGLYSVGEKEFDIATFPEETHEITFRWYINPVDDPDSSEATVYADLFYAAGDVGSDVFSEYDQMDSDDRTHDTSVGSGGSSWWFHPQESDSIADVTVGSGDSAVHLTDDGQTESFDLATGENTVNVDSEHPSTLSFDFVERSETVDPMIEVNGHETGYDGVLGSGESVSLTTDNDWVVQGENNVSVQTGAPDTGPESLVNMVYSHDKSGTQVEAEADSTAWSESYNVSHSYPSDQIGAEVVIPFASDRVVDVRDIEIRRNGGEWAEPDHSTAVENDGTELTVQVGDVDEGETVDVRAVGSKVRTSGGEIAVIEPTLEGDALETEIEIVDHSDDFQIEVTETAEGAALHYAGAQSWSDAAPFTTHTAGGKQYLHAPEAIVGGTATIQTLPLEVTPESGEIEALVDDPDEPRFSLREGDSVGASTVNLQWDDTVSGDRYVLWDVEQDREVDADVASSPVFFTTSGDDRTYTILQRDRQAGATGAPPQESGAGAAVWTLVIPAVGISVAGLWFAGRRFGGATGIRGNAVLLMGSAAVTLVAIELITPRSLASDLMWALGDAVASGMGALVGSLALLLGLWALERRAGVDIPPWILGFAATSAVVITLEAIRPGSVLGPLSGALDEVGALIIMAILALLAYLVYSWRQSGQTEITIQASED